MNTDKDLPKRKELRLKQYDYSSKGAYFVTICTQDRKRILSDITKPVGFGAHDDPQRPVEVGTHDDPQRPVGVGAHDDPRIILTRIGEIVCKYLMSSEKISGVKIDGYVIMPDHIHVMIFLDSNEYVKPTDEPSKAPTPANEMLPHVISTFKRFCRKEIGYNIFQRGYIEHIIRDRENYETRIRYMYENPIRWYYNELSSG